MEIDKQESLGRYYQSLMPAAYQVGRFLLVVVITIMALVVSINLDIKGISSMNSTSFVFGTFAVRHFVCRCLHFKLICLYKQGLLNIITASYAIVTVFLPSWRLSNMYKYGQTFMDIVMAAISITAFGLNTDSQRGTLQEKGAIDGMCWVAMGADAIFLGLDSYLLFVDITKILKEKRARDADVEMAK
jgi:hypothetical protein